MQNLINYNAFVKNFLYSKNRRTECKNIHYDTSMKKSAYNYFNARVFVHLTGYRLVMNDIKIYPFKKTNDGTMDCSFILI